MLISCYPVGAAVCRHFKFIDIWDTFLWYTHGVPCALRQKLSSASSLPRSLPLSAYDVVKVSLDLLLPGGLRGGETGLALALTLTHPIPHISIHPHAPDNIICCPAPGPQPPPDHCPCSPFAPRPSPVVKDSLDLPLFPLRSSPLSCGQGQPRPLPVPPFALAPLGAAICWHQVYGMQLA